MLRSKTVLAFCFFLVCIAWGCGGGTASTKTTNTSGGGNSGGGGNPPPPNGDVVITSLSPTSVGAGSPDLTLTITGSNLDLIHSGSHSTNTVAVWSGLPATPLTTKVVSGSQLTAVVPAALMAKPVTAQIFIQKWYFADDSPFATSNSLAFTVTTSNPSVVPAAETLGVNGSRQFVATGFDSDSGVNWTVEEGSAGGRIISDGNYTAPANTGTFHVIATSASDSSRSATALVTVSNAGFDPPA